MKKRCVDQLERKYVRQSVLFKCPVCDSHLDEKYYCSGCNRNFSEEVNFNYLKEGELTSAQIEQQDFVDNACLDFLQKFIADTEYDGEKIGIIRDALIDVLTRYYSKPEYDIYPWLLAPEKETINSA
jgi:predicted Fe-S protein YdhL (DUF1289 family)